VLGIVDGFKKRKINQEALSYFLFFFHRFNARRINGGYACQERARLTTNKRENHASIYYFAVCAAYQ
jgi:hypothetical protein